MKICKSIGYGFMLTLIASIAAAAPKKTGGAGDPTAITVGGHIIKKAQIDTLVSLMGRQKHGKNPIPQEERQVLRKLVATNLIGQELLDLEAKKLKVTAGKEEVDSLYKVFMKNYPDKNAFKAALAQAGDSEKTLMEKLARQIKVDKVLSNQIAALDRPTTKEMQAFFVKNKAKFAVNDSLRASQILLFLPKGMKADQISAKQKELETIRAKMMTDSGNMGQLVMRFSQTAAQVSESPEKKAGGDLKRFAPSDFYPEFKKHVKGLRVGELSSVFRTPLGLHLVLLTEKYDGKFDSYWLQITQVLTNEKAVKNQEKMRDYLKSLAEKYPINYLDQAYYDSGPTGLYSR